MSLIDEAKARQAKRGPSCTVGVWLAGVAPSLRAEVDEAHDAGLPWSAIYDALVGDRGLTPPKPQTWARHYAGRCNCG